MNNKNNNLLTELVGVSTFNTYYLVVTNFFINKNSKGILGKNFFSINHTTSSLHFYISVNK